MGRGGERTAPETVASRPRLALLQSIVLRLSLQVDEAAAFYESVSRKTDGFTRDRGLRSGRALMEVCNEHGAQIGWKRHAFSPAALAPHDEFSGSPVHVVEAQGRHFGGAQAETGQGGDDREVTAAAEGTAITSGEQSSDVLGLERWRQPCQPSAVHGRDSPGE